MEHDWTLTLFFGLFLFYNADFDAIYGIVWIETSIQSILQRAVIPHLDWSLGRYFHHFRYFGHLWALFGNHLRALCI